VTCTLVWLQGLLKYVELTKSNACMQCTKRCQTHSRTPLEAMLKLKVAGMMLQGHGQKYTSHVYSLSVPHPGNMELFGSSGLRPNSTAAASRSGVTEAVHRNALPGACKPPLYHSCCTNYQTCTAILAAAGQSVSACANPCATTAVQQGWWLSFLVTCSESVMNACRCVART